MRDLLFIKPRFFYLLFVPYLIIGAFAIALTTQPDLFLFFNRRYSYTSDQFFYWLTFLGNGLFFLIICLIVFLKNRGDGILGLMIFLVSALIPQLLKKIIFTDAVRPVKYFEGDRSIHLVEGVEHHSYHSFPSGHSVSVFALALFLTMVVKNKWWGFVFAAIAILTAYSRVYLSQHFFEDIYVGSCIGVISTLFIYLLFEKWVRSKKNLNKGLF